MTLPAWPLSPTAADLEAAVSRAREQLAGDGYAVAVERGEAFALLADRFARVLVDLVDGKISGALRERRVDDIRAALKSALDGWAVWVTPGELHPERPDSITDAEIYDQEKIAALRKRFGL
jgi:hypothetical protein